VVALRHDWPIFVAMSALMAAALLDVSDAAVGAGLLVVGLLVAVRGAAMGFGLVDARTSWLRSEAGSNSERLIARHGVRLVAVGLFVAGIGISRLL
jgi:hypothetical protein